MKEHKITLVVLENGRVVLEDVPVRKGQQIEVTIKVEETPPPTRPLRGLPVKLIDPFLPAVDDSEWDASK